MPIDFTQTRYLSGAPTSAHFPADSGAEIAFIGRSNAGKSSVINALCRRKKLARTGKTPGVTRMIHFFEAQPQLRLADLPGYGYARASKKTLAQWQQLTAHYLARRACVRGVILIMDSRRPLTDLDKQMIEQCAHHRLLILLAKRDKLSKHKAIKARQIVQAAVPAAEVAAFSKHSAADAEALGQIIQAWV